MTVKPVMELVTLCTVMLFMDESTFDACKTLLILQVYRLHSMSLMAVKPVMAVVRVCTATVMLLMHVHLMHARLAPPSYLNIKLIARCLKVDYQSYMTSKPVMALVRLCTVS